MSSLPKSLLRFRTELEAAIRRELEAHATAPSNGRGARLLRAVRRRPGRTMLAFAAVAGAAAAALFVSSPWKSAPGFSLERAQAALTPPRGTILHMKWEETWTSTDPACTVTRSVETWIDQTPPLRYRVLWNYPNPIPRSENADPRTFVCERGTPTELGEIGTGVAYKFVPPNSLRATSGFPFTRDPASDIREAISTGFAHDQGTTHLEGRTVRRIRIGPPSSCSMPSGCQREPWYAFVDPETFHPVELRGPEVIGVGVPPDVSVVRLHIVTQFLTYEYLPRTEANVALTDIRAQHPDAIER